MFEGEEFYTEEEVQQRAEEKYGEDVELKRKELPRVGGDAPAYLYEVVR